MWFKLECHSAMRRENREKISIEGNASLPKQSSPSDQHKMTRISLDLSRESSSAQDCIWWKSLTQDVVRLIQSNILGGNFVKIPPRVSEMTNHQGRAQRRSLSCCLHRVSFGNEPQLPPIPPMLYKRHRCGKQCVQILDVVLHCHCSLWNHLDSLSRGCESARSWYTSYSINNCERPNKVKW